MCGYLNMSTALGDKEHTKTVILRYMVVEATSTYNIISGRPTLNALAAAVSCPHLCIKYPLPGGKVGIVKGDQMTTRKCYADSA